MLDASGDYGNISSDFENNEVESIFLQLWMINK